MKFISLHISEIFNINSTLLSLILIYISPKLIEIKISNCNNIIFKSVFHKIIEKSSYINIINLSNNSWVDNDIIGYISNKINKNLKSLILENCINVTNPSMYLLSKKCVSLSALCLRCCPNISDEGLGEIVFFLLLLRFFLLFFNYFSLVFFCCVSVFFTVLMLCSQYFFFFSVF